LPNVLTDGTYTYVYGVGLAYAADANGNLQVYHTDGLGSVRAISDNNGNVIQTYQTDPFGVPTQVQGTSTQPFQFTGQRKNPVKQKGRSLCSDLPFCLVGRPSGN
ncbi:MAG TPA: hypothetical protein VNG11_06185, partial [Chloroflexota bacterium]|nr:hypothetical protein [Chloroflexota bacterium]